MTSTLEVPSSDQELIDFLKLFTSCLSQQRLAIEKGDWQQLNEVIPQLQEALLTVHRYPGGVEAFKDRIAQLHAQDRAQINPLMELASVDRRVAAELIKINLHRLSALKVLHENMADEETYGSENRGLRPGSRLSQRA